MVILDLSRVDRKTQSPLELVSYWSLLVHSKPHSKAQLGKPKRLAQLDNELCGENIQKFMNMKWFVCWYETSSFSLEHTRITD